MKKQIGLLFIFVLLGAFTHSNQHKHSEGCNGFFPADWNETRPVANNFGASYAEFNEALDRIESIYKPIIASYGAKLVVNRLWENESVNASAQQKKDLFGRMQYHINMYGGLARHEAIDVDGFIMVACHEIGHHIGGAPKKVRSPWASSEGQSDYYASLHCFRKIYSAQENINWYMARGGSSGFSSHLMKKCTENYYEADKIALCLRTVKAGQALSNLLASGRSSTQPHILTPDAKQVCNNDHSHPQAQCRLDTYYQGALCYLGDSQTLSDSDTNQGTCNRLAMYDTGLRPLCWFKPSHTSTAVNCVN